MATKVTQPSTFCFSSDIGEIRFSTSDVSARLLLKLTCNGTATTLLDETVYPSADGTVSVTDIESMVEVLLRQHLQGTLTCTLTDTAGTASITSVTVLYSMADVGTTATDFTQNHFLTTLNGAKVTAMGREERLYAYGATQVTVSGTVLNADNTTTTKSHTLNAGSTSGSVSQFDVSPSNVEALLNLTSGRLLEYTVTAGARKQKFELMEDEVPPAPSLVFTNSFGVQEFIHCTGTHSKVSKYERTSARMAGRLRNFRVVEDRQFTANTGWLNTAMADWADELFRSTEVYLRVGGHTGRGIVITDSKSELSNEDGELPSYEFTYGYAQRIHNVMQPSHAGRVFDNTFDHTFN